MQTTNRAFDFSKLFTFMLISMLFAVSASFATVTSVTLNAPANASYTNSSSVVFNVTALSNVNATLNCSLYINGAYNDSNASTVNSTATIFTKTMADGSYAWYANCSDIDGNATTFNVSETRSVVVDTAAPIVSVNSPAANAILNSSTLTILITATDTNLNYTNISVYNSTGSIVNSTTNTSGNFSISLGVPADGVFSINATAYDLAGNSNRTGNGNITVDTTAPTTTASGNNGTYTFGNWTNGNVTLTLSCTDANGSGCTTTVYCTDTNNTCTPSTNYSSGITISTEGVSYIRYKTTDVIGNVETTKNQTIKIDIVSPSVTLSVSDTDSFYSSYSGNNIIHLRANATDSSSGIATVQANFTNVSNCSGTGVVNLTYNATSGYYEGECNVGTQAATSNFAGGAAVVTTSDNASNTNISSYSQIVLYNMTTLPENDSCMEFGASTTNFSTVSNFGAVNLVLEIKVNLTCQTGGPISGAPAWTNTMETLTLFNFTSVDLSTQASAQKLSGLRTAMDINITPPGSFGTSRIYFNTTYFAELNTTTTVILYHLPFASQPSIVADANAAGYNSSSTSWSQGVGEGNLTFTVYGFSGYNITDNAAPAITINSPVASMSTTDTTPQIDVTLNGTDTQISQAHFYIDGVEIATYNSTTNTANCANASTGSELFTCIFNASTQTEGSKTLVVNATDFGGASGNIASSSVSFTIGSGSSSSSSSTSIISSTTTSNATTTSNETATTPTDETPSEEEAETGGETGGAPTVTTPVEVTISISAETETNTGVYSVVVSTRGSSSPSFTAAPVGTLPAEVQSVEGAISDATVYKYLQLTISETASNVAGATVRFEVSRDWMLENNIDPATVKLYRYVNGVWTELSTALVGDDAGNYYFEAQTPGFSYFAIAGKPVELAPVTTCLDAGCPSGYACKSYAGSYSCVKVETQQTQPTAQAETAAPTEQKGFDWTMAIGALVAIIVVAGILYFMKGGKEGASQYKFKRQ